jgi:6-pyruvoyl-tetrahydropterin synthase related domain
MGPTSGWVARHAPALATAGVVLGVLAVVFWQVHLPLLFTDTTTTGGDTGAHVMMPSLFNTILFPHLTGWDPGWYDGYPAYTFYFVLPDVLVALASHLIAYNVAFKLATLLGTVLLPISAWALGRLFGLRAPVPAALAAATLPFLFDYTWTIYGGNLFSTFAGEYSYSLSVALLLVFLGLFARGIRTGRHRAWAALTLSLCVIAHFVPALLGLAGAAVLTAVELLPGHFHIEDSDAPTYGSTRGRVVTLWWAISTVGLGLVLAAWWIVPFGARNALTTSMNYTKVTTYVSILFPEADLWALALAGVALVAAVLTRSRFGLVVAVLGGVSALAVVANPLRSLYNVRFLPLWFLCVYLMAGWVAGVGIAAAARAFRRQHLLHWLMRGTGPAGREAPRLAPWAPGAVGGALVALLAALVVVVPPFIPAVASALPGVGIQPGVNQVAVWAHWNYSGYQGKPAYPEYRALMRLMGRIGHADGCGRAMWEYDADENRFGTPEALMLLPYWTGGCIDSMEGLLFESSATTPYHFLNQAELSTSPSDAVVGLPYGPVTVSLGIRHLQLLGVRYSMAFSAQVVQEASADPTLRLLATSGPWSSTYEGERLSVTWTVYEVAHSSIVAPLAKEPAVLSGVGQGQTEWVGRIGEGDALTEGPSLRWYLDPAAWATELVADGPRRWPRISAARAVDPPSVSVRPTRVSGVRVRPESISFDVSTLGRPVLVKVSYFPNWHVQGAEGPWRATPNLMVVVPTRHHVVLTYGTTVVTEAGDAATLAGAGALVVLLVAWIARKRRARPRIG